jgi:hypothetical protein
VTISQKTGKKPVLPLELVRDAELGLHQFGYIQRFIGIQ